jgi:hypothetical protein
MMAAFCILQAQPSFLFSLHVDVFLVLFVLNFSLCLSPLPIPLPPPPPPSLSPPFTVVLLLSLHPPFSFFFRSLCVFQTLSMPLCALLVRPRISTANEPTCFRGGSAFVFVAVLCFANILLTVSYFTFERV